MCINNYYLARRKDVMVLKNACWEEGDLNCVRWKTGKKQGKRYNPILRKERRISARIEKWKKEQQQFERKNLRHIHGQTSAESSGWFASELLFTWATPRSMPHPQTPWGSAGCWMGPLLPKKTLSLLLLCSCSVMFNSFVTPWTCFRFHQPPLSMGFSRQAY